MNEEPAGCSVYGDRVVAIKPNRTVMKSCASNSQNRPNSGLGLAIVGWVSCWRENGKQVNHKRLFRVYQEAGLSVKRTRRKKLVRTGISQPVLTAPNQTSCATRSLTVAPCVS